MNYPDAPHSKKLLLSINYVQGTVDTESDEVIR